MAGLNRGSCTEAEKGNHNKVRSSDQGQVMGRPSYLLVQQPESHGPALAWGLPEQAEAWQAEPEELAVEPAAEPVVEPAAAAEPAAEHTHSACGPVLVVAPPQPSTAAVCSPKAAKKGKHKAHRWHKCKGLLPRPTCFSS